MQTNDETRELKVAIDMAASFRDTIKDIIENHNKGENLNYIVGCLVGARAMCKTDVARARLDHLLGILEYCAGEILNKNHGIH